MNSRTSFLEPDHEIYVSDLPQSSIDALIAYKPPTYLPFLWTIWRDADGLSSLPMNSFTNKVPRWLEWLEILTSHPASQRILKIVLSQSFEDWLLDDADSTPILAKHDPYVPWMHSTNLPEPFIVTRVARQDWERAQKTIESMEDNVSYATGRVDIRAVAGALWLCIFEKGQLDFSKVYMWKFKNLAEDFEINFFGLPGLLPNAEVDRIAEALWNHHYCCLGLVENHVVKWYSASIALLGITCKDRWGIPCEPCQISEDTDLLRTTLLIQGNVGGEEKYFLRRFQDLVRFCQSCIIFGPYSEPGGYCS